MCWFSKYAWVILLEGKKGITSTSASLKTLNESGRKPNRMWLVKNCELGKILSKYKNTYHGTIKMKPADVKNNTYIDSGKKSNDKDSKFKGAMKSYRKIIFVSTIKIGKNTTNIFNHYFSSYIYILAHQTKYLHVEN